MITRTPLRQKGVKSFYAPVIKSSSTTGESFAVLVTIVDNEAHLERTYPATREAFRRIASGPSRGGNPCRRFNRGLERKPHLDNYIFIKEIDGVETIVGVHSTLKGHCWGGDETRFIGASVDPLSQACTFMHNSGEIDLAAMPDEAKFTAIEFLRKLDAVETVDFSTTITCQKRMSSKKSIVYSVVDIRGNLVIWDVKEISKSM